MALQALSRELLVLQGALTAAAGSSGRSIASALSCSLGGRAYECLGRAADEASTSYACSCQAWPAAASMVSQRRGYKKHLINRPNLAQPVDVNTLDDLLQKAVTPGAAALPVLKYAAHLNPRQAAYMLQKLPRLEQLYRLRYGRQYDEAQEDAYRVLMYSLQQRLVQILPDCNSQQLQQALWGLTVAGQRSRGMAEHLLPGSPQVASGLSQWLEAQGGSAQASPGLLSHVAWYLAANGAGRQEAMDQVVRLVASAGADQQALPDAPQDRRPTTIGSGSSSAQSSKASSALTASGGGHSAAAGAAAGWDHRSLCRLAWALSHAGVKEGVDQAAAWKRVCSEAAGEMEQLLIEQAAGPPGQLRPRRRYAYRTVRGPVVLSSPMPYRPSKYMRFHGPRVSTASFDLSSTVSLLSSVARAGVRDVRCLRAAERMVVSMLPPVRPTGVVQGRSAGSGMEAAGQLPSEEQLRDSATLPGTVGGLARGPSGKLLVMQPGDVAVGAPGTAAVLPPDVARSKFGAVGDVSSLGKQAAGHLLHSFYALKYRSPGVAAAVLRNTLFSQFEDKDASQLAALAYMASAVGLRATPVPETSQGIRVQGAGSFEASEGDMKGLMGRLVLAAAPLLPRMRDQDAALLGIAAARAGVSSADTGAVGEVMGRVLERGRMADDPTLAAALAAAVGSRPAVLSA